MTRAAGLATHLLLSLVRLSAPHPVREVPACAPPAGACYWSLRPENLQPDGTVGHTASVFCVVGLFAQESTATRAFDARAGFVAALPDRVETLHLRLRPTVHRGALNWLDQADPGLVFKPEAGAEAPGAVLSMTTAGYAPGAAPSAEHVARFITNTVAVGAAMDGAPGLLFRRLFGPDDAHGDAITLSLWQSARDLAGFAYGPGSHRERMVTHAAAPFFDRASFSRFAIEDADGSWEGVAAHRLR